MKRDHPSFERFHQQNERRRRRNEDRGDGSWYAVRAMKRSPWPGLLARVLSWLALPIYAVQGIYVRETSMRLPPAEGPRTGQVGDGEPQVRLLTLGDSTAASVGIRSTLDGVAAQLARLLHENTGMTVAWRTSGHNSAVAGEVRDLVVPHIEPRDFTHILITIGTNDTKNFHSISRWKKGFGGLLYALHARFPDAKLYWSEAVDPRDVPGLPWPLAQIMRWRRDLINAKGQELCFERDCTPVRPIPDVMPAGFSVDGFHASEEGYARWAQTVAETILPDLQPRIEAKAE